MNTIELNPADALELYGYHSQYMYEEAAERGYNADASQSASAKFFAKYKELGIDCVLVAQRIANTVWSNYDLIADLKARGVDKVTIPYDMNSEYLERIAA